MLDVNLRYMEASFDLLRGKQRNDFIYRIQRKRLMDALAALSAALVRMLDEPASKQRAAEDINLFIVQNYLLVAHVAALRAILRRHVKDLPGDEVGAALASSHQQVYAALSAALARQGVPAAAAGLADAEAAGGPDEGWSVPGWPGWPLVQRRIRLLQADADKIIVHSEAIVHNVMQA